MESEKNQSKYEPADHPADQAITLFLSAVSGTHEMGLKHFARITLYTFKFH